MHPAIPQQRKALALHLLFVPLLTLVIPSFAQSSSCPNIGFEYGNFTNWVGYTWRYSTDVTSINTSKIAGIVYRRQTIMSDTTAYDSNTGNALKKIPSGFKYSAQLGDAIVSSDSKPRCWQQSLRYTMKVDSTNALLIMKFACVLQYASDHTETVEPRFKLTLYDKNDNEIPDCSNYDVYASNQNVSGFNSYTPSGSSTPVKWRDWTTVGANLLKYIGQTITIEFMATDCTGQYHYGYAYFVAQCQPLYIMVKYCTGDTSAKLTAPVGFVTYYWTDQSGNYLSSSQMLELPNPIEGATYSCKMTSATGCEVTLQSTIARYDLNAGFTNFMIDCHTNTVQFTNQSSTTHGSLAYSWTMDDGTIYTDKNPRHTFATSGMHKVKLEVANPPSTCTDILEKEVESFSPPLVGINGKATYCPNSTTNLKAYGAYQYQWSTGASTDSIEVGQPMQVWMVGKSSTGCVSDTSTLKITQEPSWNLTFEGDTTFCAGNKSTLTAYGGIKYLWSTGDTTRTYNVSNAGKYSLVGANARGCTQQVSFTAVENPIPQSNFNLSPNTIDKRHNQLEGHIDPEEGVTYCWNLGDGSTAIGTDIFHTYDVSYDSLTYTVGLTSVSQYGCEGTSQQSIDVVLFVPNVFSPNGDGINDRFMAGKEIQIMDRNGLLIYKGTDGWDGKYNGQPTDPDTYFYMISYTDQRGQAKALKGYITLVR